MADLTQALGEVLVPALGHMRAGLVGVDAGRTQLAQSARWIVLAAELAAQGDQILGDHDPRLRRVGEAQRAAGGLEEVAGDKRYNQR